MSARAPWLIVGSDGLLGRALCARLRAGGRDVIATSRRPGTGAPFLELGRGVEGWRPPRPARVAHLLSAQASLELCRRDPAGTRLVNVEAVCALAESLRRQGCFVVLPSTNLVFDGTRAFARPQDPPRPATEYGRQKAEAERRLLAPGGGAAVVRLGKVLAPGLALWKSWIEALRRGEVIRPFRDMVMAPVTAALAAEVLERVAEAGRAGVFQFCASRDVTYAEAALRLARRLGADPRLVEPVSAQAAGWRDAVAAHATMDCSRLREEFGVSPPDPEQAVDALVEL
ncbi:MAG: sugar nucleotide-binding protein [Elusimicrobia bacterium]|nr:sugar nucleotide-binding protein [Elusimicrobiota bacterium]